MVVTILAQAQSSLAPSSVGKHRLGQPSIRPLLDWLWQQHHLQHVRLQEGMTGYVRLYRQSACYPFLGVRHLFYIGGVLTVD
jgi:hypothetical protein